VAGVEASVQLLDFGADEDCDGAVDEACPTIWDPGDPVGFSWACSGLQGSPSTLLALLLTAGWLSRKGFAKFRR
jgi:hypothetical protein